MISKIVCPFLPILSKTFSLHSINDIILSQSKKISPRENIFNPQKITGNKKESEDS